MAGRNVTAHSLSAQGVLPRRVYGESDCCGAYSKLNPVHPYDLLSTVFHAAGIDPNAEYVDNLSRPRRLFDHGGPVLGLCSRTGQPDNCE